MRFRVSPGSSSVPWAQRKRNPKDIKTKQDDSDRTECSCIPRAKIKKKPTPTSIAVCSLLVDLRSNLLFQIVQIDENS